jgi:hypothetical protein
VGDVKRATQTVWRILVSRLVTKGSDARGENIVPVAIRKVDTDSLAGMTTMNKRPWGRTVIYASVRSTIGQSNHVIRPEIIASRFLVREDACSKWFAFDVVSKQRQMICSCCVLLVLHVASITAALVAPRRLLLSTVVAVRRNANLISLERSHGRLGFGNETIDTNVEIHHCRNLTKGDMLIGPPWF